MTTTNATRQKEIDALADDVLYWTIGLDVKYTNLARPLHPSEQEDVNTTKRIREKFIETFGYDPVTPEAIAAYWAGYGIEKEAA
jgi:hypothetical protein